MLHLKAHLKFRFREQSKMYANVKENIYFMLQLMTNLTVQLRGGPDTVLEGAIDGGLNVGFEWSP